MATVMRMVQYNLMRLGILMKNSVISRTIIMLGGFLRLYSLLIFFLLQITWNGSVLIPELSDLSIDLDWTNVTGEPFSGFIAHHKPEAGSVVFDCYTRYITCLLDSKGFDINKMKCNYWNNLYIVTWCIKTQVNKTLSILYSEMYLSNYCTVGRLYQ